MLLFPMSNIYESEGFVCMCLPQCTWTMRRMLLFTMSQVIAPSHMFFSMFQNPKDLMCHKWGSHCDKEGFNEFQEHRGCWMLEGCLVTHFSQKCKPMTDNNRKCHGMSASPRWLNQIYVSEHNPVFGISQFTVHFSQAQDSYVIRHLHFWGPGRRGNHWNSPLTGLSTHFTWTW